MTDFTTLTRDYGADWDGMWEQFLLLLTTTTNALEGIAGASTTSAALALGPVTMEVVPADRVYPVGLPLRAVATGNGAASLAGSVSASVPGSVTIAVTEVIGAGGPYDRWALLMAGPQGPAGQDGVSLAQVQAAALCF